MLDRELALQLQKATVAGSFLFLAQAQYEEMLSLGYVEVNYSQPNVLDNTLPVRMTALGLEYAKSLVTDVVNKPSEENMTEVAATQNEVFVIETGIPLIETRKLRVAGESKYHFDKLEVGQSFFVPNTEQRKDAVKTMVSAALAAQKRYATKTEQQKTLKSGKVVNVLEYTRKFVVKAAEKDGVQGARVWRKA